MSPPIVRVNTFVERFDKPFIDSLSKVFVISEFALGLNRLSVISDLRTIFRIVALFYTVSLIVSVIVATFFAVQGTIIFVIVNIKLVQYVFLVICSWILRNRTGKYYNELDKFNNEVGCRPKTTMGSIRIFIQMIIAAMCVVAVFLYYHTLNDVLQAIPIHIIHTMECHYYGHLISLLIPRIRLINYYMESSLAINKISTSPKDNEFVFFKINISKDINSLMDYYNTIINAHELLMGAIKWQLLVIITSSFGYILGLSYHIVLGLIRNTASMQFTIVNTILMIMDLIPLFPSCLCCDQLLAEVKRLRELIGSSLYENKLDKANRSAARALLALTKVRCLSFSLMRMINISITLPVSFVGLLVTYLIILVQFEKVINP